MMSTRDGDRRTRDERWYCEAPERDGANWNSASCCSALVKLNLPSSNCESPGGYTIRQGALGVCVGCSGVAPAMVAMRHPE